MLPKVTNPVTRALIRYHLHLFLAMTAYCALIVLRERVLPHVRDRSASLQNLIAISPLLPAAFVFAAVVRYVYKVDELKRRIVVNSLATAGGVTAFVDLGLGLMESPCWPPVSALWTFVVFGLTWIAAALFLHHHYAKGRAQ